MAEETQNPEPEKTTTTGFGKAFEAFTQHQRRAFEESCEAMDALLPPEFKEHSAVARDEFRKGVKVLVDYAIDELEKLTKEDPEAKTDAESSTDEPPSTTGRTKVKVQVD